jgi:hypothetical protein
MLLLPVDNGSAQGVGWVGMCSGYFPQITQRNGFNTMYLISIKHPAIARRTDDHMTTALGMRLRRHGQTSV